jgi:excisionase family DNA binding protein
MEERHLSLSEAADTLNISERTAYRWIKSGKLRAYKPGRDYWIPESAIKKVLEESVVRPKVPRRSPSEPSFNDVLEEERRAAWDAAVDEAQRLRETGWAQMWKALSEWQASKQREEPYAARRKYLDEMGNLLQEVYDADVALQHAYIQAADTQGGSEASGPRYLQEESRTTGRFYGELLGLVKSTGLSVLTGGDAAAAKRAAESQPAARPYSVEEPAA